MKEPVLNSLRPSACALAAVSLCFLPISSHAFLGLFEKKGKEAPTSDERQNQEAQATALLMSAREAQKIGRAHV